MERAVGAGHVSKRSAAVATALRPGAEAAMAKRHLEAMRRLPPPSSSSTLAAPGPLTCMLVTKLSFSSRLPLTRDTAATFPNASRSCCSGVTKGCNHGGGGLGGGRGSQSHGGSMCKVWAPLALPRFPVAASGDARSRSAGSMQRGRAVVPRQRALPSLRRSPPSTECTHAWDGLSPLRRAVGTAQATARRSQRARQHPRGAMAETVRPREPGGCPVPAAAAAAASRGRAAARSPQTPDRAAWRGAAGSWAPE